MICSKQNSHKKENGTNLVCETGGLSTTGTKDVICQTNTMEYIKELSVTVIEDGSNDKEGVFMVKSFLK